MTQQPFNPNLLRGAVDLSGARAAAQPRPGGPAPSSGASGQTPGAPAGSTDVNGTIVVGSDANFNDIIAGSNQVPTVLALWAEQMPHSKTHVDELAAIIGGLGGKIRFVSVELASAPAVMQALTPVLQQTFGQIADLPVVMGLLSGQPAPFYLGAQSQEQVTQLLQQFLEAAATNGVSGTARADGDAEPDAEEGAEGDVDAEPEIPEEHRAAHDLIEAGDYDGAVAAFDAVLAADPNDEDARLQRGQIDLLRRTDGLDLNAVREAAAADPADVTAQIQAADLDVAGGHVEDGFLRLIDTVKATSGDERNQVREHLLSLFELIGASDERVVKARRALMSALF